MSVRCNVRLRRKELELTNPIGMRKLISREGNIIQRRLGLTTNTLINIINSVINNKYMILGKTNLNKTAEESKTTTFPNIVYT